MTAETTELPLTGLLVVDMSQFLSGPYCSLRLHGSRCPRHQDRASGWRRPLAAGSISATRKSAAIPPFSMPSTAPRKAWPSTSRTRPISRRCKALLARADVLIQNFRPGVIERLGLDYETVKAINPRLVYACISGYGEEGPWVSRPGQDLLAQSRSGVMWLNGDESQGPVPFGLAVGDMLAGAATVQGILAALVRRGITRQGRAYRNQPAGSADRLPVRGADHPSQRRPPPAEARRISAVPTPISPRRTGSTRQRTATWRSR